LRSEDGGSFAAMTDHARIAYDAMAPIYDQYNAQNDYESWFSVLLPKLERHGLKAAGSLLDVACGTGRAVEPMRRRGWWPIMGCDISEGMVEEARAKCPEVPFDVADMTDLPVYEPEGFDLVWAMNDPVNYLIEDGDLERAIESMGRNLSGDRLLVFDCNTLGLFAANFDPQGTHRDDRWQWKPRGLVGGVWEAEVSGEGVEPHLHRERHYSVPEVHRAILNSGLEVVATMGQREDEDGLHIEDGWDEDRDHKIIHVARRPRQK
jgi:SAM-dependent methyltransferase